MDERMKSAADGADAGGKQVIARAAAVLRALEDKPHGVTLAEVVRFSGLPSTTANRIVQALEAQQFVVSTSKGLRLGPALMRLAAAAHTDIVDIARPHVEALGRRLRETVHCSVPRGRHMIVVDQFEADQELRVAADIGQAHSLHCTGHGLAMPASLRDADVERLLGTDLEIRTPNTVGSIAALFAKLREVRETGIGIDLEEHAEGVCGLGVVIETGTNDRYTISVAAPTRRFQAQVGLFKAAIQQCKAAIEASANTT